MSGTGERGSDLGDSVRRTLAEEEDGAGVLVLTPGMRSGGGAFGAPMPASLPPAEDEEPPLLLTRRVDGGGPAASPEPPAWAPAPGGVQPDAARDDADRPAPSWSSASGDPAWTPAPEAPAWTPEPEAPAWSPQPEAPAWSPEPEAPSGSSATETPSWPSSSDETGAEPAPASFAQPPSWGPAPESAPSVEDLPEDARTPPFPGETAQPAFQPAEAPEPIAPDPVAETPAWSAPPEPEPAPRAAAPEAGWLRPSAADPEVAHARSGASSRELRAAFSDATPGPLAATGLPRNRDELVEIVRQSIREELAGPLGERISHNIRALVDREVERALAERDRDEGR